MEDPFWISELPGDREVLSTRNNWEKGLDEAENIGTTMLVDIRTVSLPPQAPKMVSIYMAGWSGKEYGLVRGGVPLSERDW